MKTGRLIKLHRPGGDVHIYLYKEGEGARASVYVMAPGRERSPVHVVSGPDEDRVEAEARAWVDAHLGSRHGG